MPRVTIKSLQEEIETLKAINTYQTGEIKKLNTEIENLKDNGTLVSKSELDILNEQLKEQKLLTSEYKKLYENLRNEHKKERDEYIFEIKRLQESLNNSERQVNERNAGRKAYSNEKVIKMIYNLYIDGKSLQAIADELNRLEIKTKRGKAWSKSSIRFILLNSKNVTNGFISQDIFDSTVNLLNDNRK